MQRWREARPLGTNTWAHGQPNSSPPPRAWPALAQELLRRVSRDTKVRVWGPQFPPNSPFSAVCAYITELPGEILFGEEKS